MNFLLCAAFNSNSSQVSIVPSASKNPIEQVAEKAIAPLEEQGSKKRKVTYYLRETSDLASSEVVELPEFKIHRLMNTHQRQSSVPIFFETQLILDKSEIVDTKRSDVLIIKAISSGDLEEFKKLLRKRQDLQKDINTTVWNEDCFGLTCVHWAVKAQKIDVIRFLVEEQEAEIDLDANLDDGWLPAIVRLLDEGSQTNTLQIAEYLVQNGASINDLFFEEEWRTPLGYYATKGDLKNLKMMVYLGADIDTSVDQEKPLSEVINILLDDPMSPYKYEFFANVVEYLIEEGATLDSSCIEECLTRIEEALSIPDISTEKIAALGRVQDSLNSLH